MAPRAWGPRCRSWPAQGASGVSRVHGLRCAGSKTTATTVEKGAKPASGSVVRWTSCASPKSWGMHQLRIRATAASNASGSGGNSSQPYPILQPAHNLPSCRPLTPPRTALRFEAARGEGGHGGAGLAGRPACFLAARRLMVLATPAKTATSTNVPNEVAPATQAVAAAVRHDEEGAHKKAHPVVPPPPPFAYLPCNEAHTQWQCTPTAAAITKSHTRAQGVCATRPRWRLTNGDPDLGGAS